MAYKVKIFCKECNTRTTRNFIKPRIERFQCKVCNAKRQLTYTDDHEAFATRYDHFPQNKKRKPPERIEKNQTIEPTEEENKLFQEETNPLGNADIKIEKVRVDPRPTIGMGTQAAFTRPSQYLQPEHVKLIVQLPFHILAAATEFEGMKLSEKEATDLGNNEAIQRAVDKYLGSFVGKYPDEYTALMFIGLALIAKMQIYQKYKNEVLEHERQRGENKENRSETGDNSGVTGTPHADIKP